MIKNFKNFYCNKVLPLVYDNSLSFYELLCKVVSKLNEIIDFINSPESLFGVNVKYVQNEETLYIYKGEN